MKTRLTFRIRLATLSETPNLGPDPRVEAEDIGPSHLAWLSLSPPPSHIMVKLILYDCDLYSML